MDYKEFEKKFRAMTKDEQTRTFEAMIRCGVALTDAYDNEVRIRAWDLGWRPTNPGEAEVFKILREAWAQDLEGQAASPAPTLDQLPTRPRPRPFRRARSWE